MYGSFDIILEEHPQIYSYTRTLGEEKLVVILNFSGEQPNFEMPEHVEFAAHELVISNYEVNAEEKIQAIELKPYEARVYRLLK
ncbi:alpha-glucosidase C-terminal domain-containing protein [Fictibacillus sp. FJAT-27399]|uniref:alpha-glucosidase C-terminal domain-containing protein n=1 Tax=Fictibacillus sp. FJAT-27399 TaxID=1729689 RepID=UPI000785C47A|nr:alpha-glucosidase C-terminal domain-containing protein [Fictibacillus sp. FJAT-27399]